MMAGKARRSCRKKTCPPSNIAELGAGDGAGQELAVGRRGDPVETAAADERWAGDGPEAAGRVVLARAASWLARPAAAGPGSADPASMRSAIRATVVGVGRSPGLVPPGVEQFDAGTAGRSCRGRALTSSCKGYDAPPAPPADVQARTRRRTRSGCRMAELLGHHAAEGDAEDEAVVPADGVEEGGGVVGEVGHGRRARRHAALPEAALVVDEQLERPGQGAVGQPRLVPQVAPGARDAQEPIARPLHLVVERDAVDGAPGHPVTVPTAPQIAMVRGRGAR